MTGSLAFIWSWIWFQKSSRKEKYFSSGRSFFSREVQQVAQSSGSSRYTLFANWQLGRYQNWSPTVDICWSYFQFQPTAGIPLQAMTTKQEKETTDDVSVKQWHLFPHVLQLTKTKTVTYISNICSVIQIATQLLSQCICQAGSRYLLWIVAYCYITKVVKNITSEIFREKYRTFYQIWP